MAKICDTRCQLFRNQTTKNEESLRLKWFIKNEQRLIENLGNERFVSKAKALIADREEKRRKESKVEQIKKVQSSKPLSPWRPSNIDGSINVDSMKPINPEVRAILYGKGVENYTAKNNYLYQRYKEAPENRFYFPDCTSWIYGWHLRDYPPVEPTKVGIASVIQSTFYRRNASSLQRDPEWYRLCQTRNPKNFNEILTY